MNYWTSDNLSLELEHLVEQNTQDCLGKMQELESGAISNPDENRMVGHYWLRAPELSPTKEIKEDIEREISRVLEFEKNCSFKNVLLIGIGGSSLGPRFLYEALARKSKRKLFFIDNTDPDGISKTLLEIPDLKDCLVVITSKSGSTKETRNAYIEVGEAFKKKGLEIKKQTVAVTQKSSLLDNDDYLERFYFWDFVGGRTSVTSAVGLLSLALFGGNVGEFLKGAREMDKKTRAEKDNPALNLALSWLEYRPKAMVVLPYADRLEYFPRYLQQLVMESLGKEKDLSGKIVNSGLTVYGNKGSTDQHAYVQQLRDGPDDFFVTFIEVLKDYSTCEVEPGVTAGDYLFGFLEGTKKALSDKGRKSISISIPEINEESIGALIALYERAVGFYAFLINVNAYNQPGVEAGKVAAGEILELQKKVKEFKNNSEDEILKKLNCDPALLKRILRRTSL